MHVFLIVHAVQNLAELGDDRHSRSRRNGVVVGDPGLDRKALDQFHHDVPASVPPIVAVPHQSGDSRHAPHELEPLELVLHG